MEKMQRLNEAHYFWSGIIVSPTQDVKVEIPDNVHLQFFQNGSLLFEYDDYVVQNNRICFLSHEYLLLSGDKLQIFATVIEEG